MGLRIAFFGQAPFGKDVLVALADAGHTIAGVFVPPDGARPDPCAAEAAERGFPLLRQKRFRRKGEAVAEIVAEYRSLGAELNVLAFVTAILPVEIIDGPVHKSLCFHPSLLPRFRGGAALAWQVIEGEAESGVTVFQPDAGVDTGPIAVQRGGVRVSERETAGSLYFQHLYGLGVEALVEAVAQVAEGRQQLVAQDEARATFQGLVGDDEARIDWSRDAAEIDRLIRGCDPQPGAHALCGDRQVRFFDGHRAAGVSDAPTGTVLGVEAGELIVAARGGRLAIGRVRVAAGPKQPAAEAGLVAGDRLR
jgi:methionyl-tRNA formyltransferase